MKMSPKWREGHRKALLTWYLKNRRDLPWRENRDPYRVWISEVMLQQTTTKAVIPYYQQFLSRFPDLKSLAAAGIEDVLRLWSGLGYYSRARNLHRAAVELNRLGNFPKTAVELINYPGFGPYTSRAVTSIAFSEPVGVLDGNVIRVLSRFWGIRSNWWLPKARRKLQDLADGFVHRGPSHELNQAVMELGATICTPKDPRCTICPWFSDCKARIAKKQRVLPKIKPRKKLEYWVWRPTVICHGKKVFLVPNDYAPFLKNTLIPPGKVVRTKARPLRYDFRHTITHHDIFVQVNALKDNISKQQKAGAGRWVEIDKVSEVNPSALVTRTIGLK